MSTAVAKSAVTKTVTLTSTSALLDLDSAAKGYRAARDVVSERVADLDDEIRAIYRRRLPGIKSAIVEAKTAQDAAAAAVQRNAILFAKPAPRTMVLRGIKLGFKAGVGSVSWEADDGDLVARIERIYKSEPEKLELLIITKKKPSKDALKTLEAVELAKLGVEVEGVGDFVVVSDSDSDAKALMKRILKEGAVHEVAPNAD